MKQELLLLSLGFACALGEATALAQAPSARAAKPTFTSRLMPPAGSASGKKGERMAPEGSARAHGGKPDMLHPMGPGNDRTKARTAELMATNRARRAARAAMLHQRFGARALSDQSLVAELKLHARRMAYLNRARLVAENEIEEPKRSKVLARIQKLVDKEGARHERRVAKFTNPMPAPSGSAAEKTNDMPAPSAAASAGGGK